MELTSLVQFIVELRFVDFGTPRGHTHTLMWQEVEEVPYLLVEGGTQHEGVDAPQSLELLLRERNSFIYQFQTVELTTSLL